MNATILWIIAAVIAVIGIIVLIGGSVLWGVIVLVAAPSVEPRRQHLPATFMTGRWST